MTSRDELLKYFRDELKATEISPNGFMFIGKGEANIEHQYFAVVGDGYLMLSALILGTEGIDPHQILAATQNLPFGVSIMGDSYVFKHLVTLDGMNTDVFRRELQMLGASLEVFRS